MCHSNLLKSYKNCSQHNDAAGRCSGFLLIAAICVLIYANTWNASWHMDDFPNIVTNPLVHIQDISITSLLQATNLFQDQNALYSGIPYRPVADLTFALNWYAGGDQVWGYHAVNIGIHILCAGCLYLLLLALFQTPNISGRFQGMENDIALLAAVFWAILPIQTQAVTYIVQRMCLLAALFYISGMWCYVRARLSSSRWRQPILYPGCFFCLLLALGSKENAVMLPLSLGCIEIIFFQNFSIRRNGKKCLLAVVVAAASTLVIALVFADVISLNPVTFIERLSKTRSFTVGQRLLTEPRIVMGYLIQIFFPLLHSFSIEHPVTVSTSLLTPVTTLLSLLMIAGLILTALYRLRSSPILSFSILFYFINHIIESSIIPLELVFEHRNYLPSLFIFLPAAAGIVRGIRYYQNHRSPFMAGICASLTVLLIVVFGLTAYARNQVWHSEKTLWEDVLLKAPDSARPYAGLAWYYNETGQPDVALKFYKASLSKQWARSSFLSIPLCNMAGIYIRRQDYPKALDLYNQSLACDPTYLRAMYGKAVLLTMTGKWDEARQAAEILVSQKTMPWDDLNLMGYILIRQREPEAALKYLRRADFQSPRNPKIYVNIGIAMSMMGYCQRADWFLIQASQMAPGDMIPVLALISNHIKSRNVAYLNVDMDTLFRWFTIDNIRDTLRNLSENKLQVPVSAGILSPVIAEALASRYNRQVLRRFEHHE